MPMLCWTTHNPNKVGLSVSGGLALLCILKFIIWLALHGAAFNLPGEEDFGFMAETSYTWYYCMVCYHRLDQSNRTR